MNFNSPRSVILSASVFHPVSNSTFMLDSSNYKLMFKNSLNNRIFVHSVYSVTARCFLSKVSFRDWNFTVGVNAVFHLLPYQGTRTGSSHTWKKQTNKRN